MKRSFKHLTEKDFLMITTLKEAGLARKKINDITGRSNWTISLILASSSFSDYQKRSKEYQLAHKGKATVKQEPIEESINGFAKNKASSTLVAEADVVPVLNRIADSLDRLADAWETQSMGEVTTFR